MPSRFSTVAKWRIADCDWEAGDFENARKGYEAVLPSANDLVEPAVARFRIGEALAKKGALPAAQQQWRKVYVGEPMHPLAEEALARLTESKAPPITPEERIARAKILTNNRGWPRALEELALVPADVPQAVRDETDYWIGTTKFHMRRDYDIAAQKLLGVWQRMPTEERKVDALFHGARAWSRADKDDEAQKGYRELLHEISAHQGRAGGVVPHRLARFQSRQVQRGDPGARGDAQALRRLGVRRRRALVSRLFTLAPRRYRRRARRLREAGQDVGRVVGRQGRVLARPRARPSSSARTRRRRCGARWSTNIRFRTTRCRRARGSRSAASSSGRSARAPRGRRRRSRPSTSSWRTIRLIMRADELLAGRPHRRGQRRARPRRRRLHQALRRGAGAADLVRPLFPRRKLPPSASAGGDV